MIYYHQVEYLKYIDMEQETKNNKLMKELKDDDLQFVIDNYRDKMFDTHSGLSKVKERIKKKRDKIYNLYILAGIAASILIIVGFFFSKEIGTHKTNIVANSKVIKYILPDSTVVFLSPGSSLSYMENDFKNQNRNVTMKGKAYFSVSKHERIPFLVSGQHSVTKVLGTEFQIEENLSDSTTEIYVISGRVLFASTIESDKGVILTEGMKAHLVNKDSSPVVEFAPTPNPLAWANGIFVYNETPIDVVLNELSDFYNVQLQSTGTNKKITGRFRLGSLDEILEVIEESLRIKIKKEKQKTD